MTTRWWSRSRPTCPGREACTVPDSWDDEKLLAALGEAIRARQAVPEWFVETGKNAYAWLAISTFASVPAIS